MKKQIKNASKNIVFGIKKERLRFSACLKCSRDFECDAVFADADIKNIYSENT